MAKYFATIIKTRCTNPECGELYDYNPYEEDPEAALYCSPECRSGEDCDAWGV